MVLAPYAVQRSGTVASLRKTHKGAMTETRVKSTTTATAVPTDTQMVKPASEGLGTSLVAFLTQLPRVPTDAS